MKLRDVTPIYAIPAVAHALQLLDLFSATDSDFDRITISHRMVLLCGRAAQYFNALEELPYINWNAGVSTYHQSLKLFQLDRLGVNRPDIRVVARPIMEALA